MGSSYWANRPLMTRMWLICADMNGVFGLPSWTNRTLMTLMKLIGADLNEASDQCSSARSALSAFYIPSKPISVHLPDPRYQRSHPQQAPSSFIRSICVISVPIPSKSDHRSSARSATIGVPIPPGRSARSATICVPTPSKSDQRSSAPSALSAFPSPGPPWKQPHGYLWN